MNTLNLFSNNQKYHKFTTAERLTKETLGYTIIAFRGNEYAVDFNSEESRNKFKNYINSLTKESHKWFKEVEGNKNWVLYNEKYFYVDNFSNLRFKNKTDTFEMPINMSSCRSMFYECRLSPSFHFPEDFDTSNMIAMHYMFFGATFQSDITFPEDFDTSNVVDMRYMFSKATFQSDITFPESFNSKNLKYAGYMFMRCKAMGYLHLPESFNCRDCVSMPRMFGSCNFLNGFRLSNNFSIRDDTNIHGIFSYSILPTDFKFPQSFNYLSVSQIKDMRWGNIKDLPQQLQDLYYKKQREGIK